MELPAPFRAGVPVEKFGHLVTDGILISTPARCCGLLGKRREVPRELSGPADPHLFGVGQPHRHADELADLLTQGTFDR